MRKILTIIKREYKEAVFKKSFIIITLLIPVLMIGMAVLPTLLLMIQSKKITRVHVIDQTNWLFDELQQNLTDTLKNGQLKYQLSKINVTQNDLNNLLNEQKELIKSKKIDVLLVFPANIDSVGQATLYARNIADFDLISRFKNTISKLVSNHRLLASGIEPHLVNKLIKPVKLETIKILRGRKESKSGFLNEYFTTFIFIFILYFTILLYATAIMRSIIQEKNSRIVETILSGANAHQFMAGKILGQGAVGITQYTIWLAIGIALFFASGRYLPAGSFNISPIIFLYFVIFYILGYFLFSSIYAAIGAIVNSEQEAQSLLMPVVMILVIPLALFSLILKDPNSIISTTFSLIPFFSPLVMFARINIANPPAFQIISSIIILILTIAAFIWFVAKIFRVGILMYGKRPTLIEIIKWIRY